ncbi:transmembrane protein 243 isoform X1 [Bubalus kerabau]|uniref:transmembrane protein 243 isoform X1 n=1 Tax=Bubalus bubalis TaxID=89462 RepID=UPI001D127ADF|nr:transmembrane protein 243 isoform X1 [Bubalus bubalis]XP_044802503.1 transmembrane protein 243 isoform X1 [Bubalus bubalis]XP_055446034.1 transmembrane protein 243 isoform X1 [Bubalus carabanensis]XP_055446035.1 transmembrane protein 243 isoform X1 [Bubalus carabanensis]
MEHVCTTWRRELLKSLFFPLFSASVILAFFSSFQAHTRLRALDRIINLVVGSLTSLLILVTLISAFVFPQLPPKPLNIFFAVCISLSSITACILIYWYRQGDLEPKFRNLIYYILFSIIMLCICANLYFHDVGK